MEDSDIIILYFARDQRAIDCTAQKYGPYCRAIAGNIVDAQDAEECVSDTYLKAWNTMPPKKPSVLGAYLGRITRNLSFDRYRKNTAQKRGGGETHVVLDELSDCISGSDSVMDEVARRALVRDIEGYLDTLTEKKRRVFLLRYWYAFPIGEIGKRTGLSAGNVSVILNRTRQGLKAYLEERGHEL